MPLVPAKCPECGGNINIESEQRLGVCEYCKQPFVVQEAINHFNTTYNITNNNEIKTDVVNIFEQSENKDTAINDIIAKVEIARKSGKIRYEEAKTELFEYLDKYASDIQLKKRSLGIVVSYAMEDLSKDILWWKDISQIAELVDAITLLGGVLSDDEKEMYDEFCRNVLDKLTQDYGPWDKICDNANNNADRSKRIFVLDFLSVMKTSACPKMLSEKYDDINNGVARGYFGHYYYTTYFTGGSDGWDEPCLGYVQECIQSREQLEDYLLSLGWGYLQGLSFTVDLKVR